MTTDPNNPLNITDEDIGKKGRFLVGEIPAVLIGIALNANGSIYRFAFKVTDRAGRQWFAVSDPDDREVTRAPRKLYIGISPKAYDDGVFDTTFSYPTRQRAVNAARVGWTILEIPHPEDVVK